MLLRSSYSCVELLICKKEKNLVNSRDIFTYQFLSLNSVVDPGFIRGHLWKFPGGAYPRGNTNLLFGIILAENCMEMNPRPRQIRH